MQFLPTIHALTGCDTTSKVGTKLQAYKAANKMLLRAFINNSSKTNKCIGEGHKKQQNQENDPHN